MKKILLLLYCLALATTKMLAQGTNSAYTAYIETYASMAVDQMNRYGIPASITLAQGLLESGAGKSMLATKANNHFGIKTGGSWNGPYVLRDDDRPNEQFRKYNSVAESYEDHSLFLKKKRYESLFRLSPTDYKGWAAGLKACGYATSPTYAQSLCTIIENYRLYEFDNGTRWAAGGTVASHGASSGKHHNSNNGQQLEVDYFFAQHPVYENNKNEYIRLLPGDKLSYVAKMLDIKESRLRKYNEIGENSLPEAGCIIYLKKKRSHAHKAFKKHPHTLVAGQSMWDVAQMYGMTLKSLYKINKLGGNYRPKPGDVLKLY